MKTLIAVLIVIATTQAVFAQQHRPWEEGLRPRPPLVGTSKIYKCSDGSEYAVVMGENLDRLILNEPFHSFFNFCPVEFAANPLVCAQQRDQLTDRAKACLYEFGDLGNLTPVNCEGGVVAYCTRSLLVRGHFKTQ